SYTTYREIEPLGHITVNHEGTASTCVTHGYKPYVTCLRCDYTTFEELPFNDDHFLVHHTGVPSTCVTHGYADYDTCSRCDYTTYQELPLGEHSLVYHEGVASTCVTHGHNAYNTCSVCDYTTYEELPFSEHDVTHYDAVASTCTTHGHNAYDACKNCTYSTYTELPFEDHVILVRTVKPTATEQGYDLHYCKNCDYSYKDNYTTFDGKITYVNGQNYYDFSGIGYDKTVFYKNELTTAIPDPCVIEITDETSPEYGYFYLYGTGSTTYRSKDLVSWENTKRYYDYFAEDSWEGSDFWAPEVIYDKDADPTHYGLEKPAQGKGCYYLIYSSTPKSAYRYGSNVASGYTHQTGLAVATHPQGPFTMWTGKELGATIDGVNYGTEEGFAKYTTDQNTGSVRARKGDKVNRTDPWLNYSAIRAVLKKQWQAGTGYFAYDMSNEYFSTIDSSPFVDNDGTKYLIVRFWHHNASGTDKDGNTIEQSTSNFIIKTLNNDWAQLDYSTTTIMNRTHYNFTSQAAAEEYNRQAKAYDPSKYNAGVKETTTFKCEKADVEKYMNVGVWNEGAQLYHNPDNGLYYLSVSIAGTSESKYTVIQAVAYNVFGPYRKLSIAEGGILSSNNLNKDVDNVSAPGHHFVLKLHGELAIVYHKHYDGSSSRGTCVDKLIFVPNNQGLLVMHDNGPTTTYQPIFYGTGATPYDNIAKDATVTASSTNHNGTALLTDGALLIRDIGDSWATPYVGGQTS
ncbi:MAG: hypothetical protein MJ072_01900, partial [Clostridia bacterium]|nr:hypothetical protein [Clostridia bacterium]